MRLPPTVRRALPVVGALALVACDPFGADEEVCTPLAPTTPQDLWTLPWVQLQTPQGFCNVAVAYQYQIYAFASVPLLVDEYDGFMGEMTFPPGSRVTPLSSGGAEVFHGDQSGEVCGRHWNACTAPGEFACQPLTIVDTNVFSATRNELLLYQGGALAYASGAVWYMQPRAHPGVWRMDPATFVWEKVVDTFPRGGEGNSSYTGGEAIAAGTDIWYLANGEKFRFDTVTRTWSDGTPTERAAAPDNPSFEFEGKLYVHGAPGYVFDPATGRNDVAFGGTLARPNMVAWVRGDSFVVGGGTVCDERDIACWRQDFEILDRDLTTATPAPFTLPGFRAARGAIDFDDRTIVLAHDGTAWLLLDTADAFVELPRNPALADCTPKVPPPGAIRQSILTYGGDRAIIVGGEAADNLVTIYLR